MYRLFQSKLRKDIQIEVYNKPYFETELFWKSYFWLIKRKNIWPFTIQRLQIMWVVFPDDRKYIKEELKIIQKKYKKERGNMFIQFWSVNEIIRFKNLMNKSDEFKQEMRNMRFYIRNFMKKDYWLVPSFKENMPQSTIMINTDKTDEALFSGMKESAQRQAKKWIKKDVEFREINESEYDLFYEKWKTVSSFKWFSIIEKDNYIKLLNFLKDNKCGKVLVTEKDNDIIAWSIYLYDDYSLTMLYGFYDRSLSKLWWQHYLKLKSLSRARDHWLHSVDLMWGSPTGFPNHPLHSVSQFKESLWGKKVEFYGNFDLILNPLLYFIFKLYYKIKKIKTH